MIFCYNYAKKVFLMAKVILDVKEENLGAVLTVLNALKSDLIQKMDVTTNIEHNEVKKQQSTTRYQPKQNRVIYEEEQLDLQKSGKYLNPSEFKKRMS